MSGLVLGAEQPAPASRWCPIPCPQTWVLLRVSRAEAHEDALSWAGAGGSRGGGAAAERGRCPRVCPWPGLSPGSVTWGPSENCLPPAPRRSFPGGTH